MGQAITEQAPASKSRGEFAKDVRSFIELLQRTGDAVVIDKEVGWDLQLGAISRRAVEIDGPAILFRNIQDYPGQGMFVDPIATWRRAAITLGLPPHARIPEIYQAYMRGDANPIPPATVKDAVCREVIRRGKDVDLTDLAVPMIHEGDGGRYLGTWDIVVTKDPDTGWMNWGTYRFMVHHTQYLAGWPIPASHLGTMLREKYLPRKQPMPIAIAMGADPCSHLAATSTTRIGRDEASLAGGLAGQPIEIARCLDSDLTFPACAEVVLEGEILPDQIAMEGPYAEFPGYRSGEMGAGITMKVNTICHRKNPILTMDCTGFKDCSSIVAALGGGVAIQRRLERAGVPVTGVYVPSEGAVHLCIVGVRKGGREVTEKVLHALTGRRSYMTKILVVEDDIDIFNLSEVIHAWATRCHSERGTFIKHVEGSALAITPCYSQEERDRHAGASVAFDVSFPPEWDRWETPVRATFDKMYPDSVKNEVLENWKAYGL